MKQADNTHAQLEKEVTILRKRLARLEPFSTRVKIEGQSLNSE
jgi:hypothetical protein